jgi:hypothetical protein
VIEREDPVDGRVRLKDGGETVRRHHRDRRPRGGPPEPEEKRSQKYQIAQAPILADNEDVGEGARLNLLGQAALAVEKSPGHAKPCPSQAALDRL